MPPKKNTRFNLAQYMKDWKVAREKAVNENRNLAIGIVQKSPTSPGKGEITYLICHFNVNQGKISAQPHTTLCIQFLDRENDEKKQYIAIGKTDLFDNSMGLCGNFT